MFPARREEQLRLGRSAVMEEGQEAGMGSGGLGHLANDMKCTQEAARPTPGHYAHQSRLG